MRQNYNLNKRKREEAKKKKHDEKIARRLANKNQPESLPAETQPQDPGAAPEIQPEA